MKVLRTIDFLIPIRDAAHLNGIDHERGGYIKFSMFLHTTGTYQPTRRPARSQPFKRTHCYRQIYDIQAE